MRYNDFFERRIWLDYSSPFFRVRHFMMRSIILTHRFVDNHHWPQPTAGRFIQLMRVEYLIGRWLVMWFFLAHTLLSDAAEMMRSDFSSWTITHIARSPEAIQVLSLGSLLTEWLTSLHLQMMTDRWSSVWIMPCAAQLCICIPSSSGCLDKCMLCQRGWDAHSQQPRESFGMRSRSTPGVYVRLAPTH